MLKINFRKEKALEIIKENVRPAVHYHNLCTQAKEEHKLTGYEVWTLKQLLK